MDLLHLKSGTDVRGTAVDEAAPEQIDLTDEVVRRVTAAFVPFLAKKSGKRAEDLKISVGHDSRVSAERIRHAVLQELTVQNVHILDCGLCSTPAMFMTTQTEGCDGAVQITASHHPWDRNGLKFFTRAGGISGAQLTEILSAAETVELCAAPQDIRFEQTDYLSVYCAHLQSLIKEGVQSADYDHPLAGMKIVVDAGNGVGGFYADRVLAPLGADTAGSCCLDPDGRFPNHVPNPENAEAMESVRQATLRAHADLGVIFDTDVDRGAAVTANGEALNRNRLVAVAAAIALEESPGGTIVTDSVTSAGLTKFINETLGGKHLRFKRGYKNVIDEAERRTKTGENVPLAIETSGHAAFCENYFLDDGAYLVTRIIIKLCRLKREGKTLDTLLAALEEPAEEAEVRLPIAETDFRACGERVLALVEERARASAGVTVADDSYEGVKVIFPEDAGDGFFILRLSVHDPLLPVNLESAKAGGVRRIAQALLHLLSGAEGIDLLPLQQFCGEIGKGY